MLFWNEKKKSSSHPVDPMKEEDVAAERGGGGGCIKGGGLTDTARDWRVTCLKFDTHCAMRTGLRYSRDTHTHSYIHFTHSHFHKKHTYIHKYTFSVSVCTALPIERVVFVVFLSPSPSLALHYDLHFIVKFNTLCQSIVLLHAQLQPNLQ